MKRVYPAVMAAVFFALALPLTAAPAPAPAPAAVDPLANYTGASAACKVVLNKVVGLMNEGKWRSAYAALDAFDPKNTDPFALAMKVKICMAGFITTEMHQSFSLRDLQPGEDLSALREAGGEYEMLKLDPVALAAAQSVAGVAAPAILSKVLGDYYYDVESKYSGQWVIPDDEIYKRSLESYEKAYAGGVFDADSLQNQAELLMRFDRSTEAEPLFRKSLTLNPANPMTHYNLAMSLINENKKVDALDELERAFVLYKEPSSRFDALALSARVATDVGDVARAESYLAKAEAEFPGQPSPGVLRHYIAIQGGNAAAADKAADALMERYAASPSVVRSLVTSWYSANKIAAAVAFLERNIAKTSDDKSLGTLKFYYAILLVQGEPTADDRAKALALLDQTEAHMKKALPATDDVFDVITRMKQQIQASSPATAAPATAAPAPAPAPAPATKP